MAVRQSGSVDWQRFEHMVFICESVLSAQHRNVRVAFNDYVKGVTKRPRQCDATIRVDIGSMELLIILECRKRRTRDDIRWIEQASSKRQLLRAARIVLISERGFGEPAQQAATHLDVELRTFEQITKDDILGWLPSTHLLATGYHRNVIDARVITEPLPDRPEGEVVVVPSPPSESRFVSDSNPDRRFDFKEFWAEIDPFKDDAWAQNVVWSKIPSNVAVDLITHVGLASHPNGYRMAHEDLLLRVTSVAAVMRLIKHEKEVAPTDVVRYGKVTDHQAILRSAFYPVTLGPLEMTVGLHADGNSIHYSTERFSQLVPENVEVSLHKRAGE